MSMKTLCACVLLAAASACASKAPVSGASDSAPAPTSRNRDVITQDDLASDPTLRAQSVLEVIRALRPQFLSERGTNTYSGTTTVSAWSFVRCAAKADMRSGFGVEANTLVWPKVDLLLS